MAARPRWFVLGFVGGVLLFALLNIAAAHLRSDCGITAVIGLWLPRWSVCNDDIVRVGFPFLVLEQGGFAYHSDFHPLNALLDGGLAIAAGLLTGSVALRFAGAGRRAG
jgi:hypothetical protein